MGERSHIAELLKAARKARGLSVEVAATQSGMPLRYVHLLEGEPSTIGIPDELYLIPFFRKYAVVVGLEVDKLLPEFLGQVQRVPADPPAQVTIGLGRPFSLSIANLWRPAAVVTAVALATFLMMRNSPEPIAIAGDPEAALGPAAHVHEPAAAPGAAATDSASRIDRGRVELAQGAVSGADIVRVASAALDEPDTARASADAPVDTPASGARELHIVATETVWVEIGRDDGPGEEFWLEPGDTHTLTANDSFSLKVGNAGGLSLAFDGRALPPLGESGQVVRVRLPHPTAHANGG